MIDSQSVARKPRRFAHFAAAAAVLLALSPAAKAQGLFSFFGGGPSPYEIERRLEAGGYALAGPLIRRGDVYVADVVVGGNDFERLVIDAESGRIVQRFRARPARWREADPGDWSQGEAYSRDSPPRPPAELVRPPASPPLDLSGARPQPPASTRDQFARGDSAAKPTVALGRDARSTSSDLIKKPKPKPRDAERKTVVPAAAAEATNPPAAESAAAKAAEPAAAAVAVAPPAAAAAPAASPPPPTQAANADAPANVVAAKSPPPAQTPETHAPAKAKAVNDLPVTPLD